MQIYFRGSTEYLIPKLIANISQYVVVHSRALRGIVRFDVCVMCVMCVMLWDELAGMRVV